ncbi:transmembrane protein 65 isoform X1 [Bos indicus]|uniref:Transmembrane protein 65 isoform X1 n=2 Tax=Bovinae TaxID=27592 RepID=A0ABM4TEX0_BOSIN|nr:transmembrane protein 65 isoform X1 [Bos indicus x Bos taurus]XP_044784738.2 transmembrane protein 65 isoform X1 [Bubalus bubalis]
MSRLLPLLRSRTARSLRPGPAAAAAPRPPSWCCCGRGLLALAAPGGPRALGTHPKKEPIEALNTAQGARDFIYSLHSSERSCLLKELHRFESIAIAQACRYPKPEIAIVKRAKEVSSAETPDSFGISRCSSQLTRTSPHSVRTVVMMRVMQLGNSSEKLEAQPPTPGQLRYVFIHNAIPFIGFGFLDNAIMIVAGTHIELSIGIILGISTMAAAALGNLVSDLAGLGLAGYVEALASRLGLSIPDLSPKQVDMWQTRVSSHLGKAVGVTIGCILGMFPLIFFGGGEDDEKLEKKN